LSRIRIAVAGVVLVVFIGIGAYLIFANRNAGGTNVTINVTVTGAKTMSPSELSVHLNDTVTINMTSNNDGEVHLHGYDIHFDTKAGQTVGHTFKADKAARFDIEWESTSAPLGHLTVNP
jgi:uncharacterized protein YxeA